MTGSDWMLTGSTSDNGSRCKAGYPTQYSLVHCTAFAGLPCTVTVQHAGHDDIMELTITRLFSSALLPLVERPRAVSSAFSWDTF